MKKLLILVVLLLTSSLRAQIINPGQGGGGGGVIPGQQFKIGQYNSSGTNITQTNMFTDATGNSLNYYFYANLFATGAGTSGSPYTSSSGTGGIQEAVNAAEALPVVNGGFAPTVYLPSGSYAVSFSILITKTINLVGAGWATQLTPTNSNSPVILIQPTGSAEIKGMDITGLTIAANASGGTGITIDGTRNVIAHLHIFRNQIYQQGTSGYGISMLGAGAAQGTPVISMIEDNQIVGGISMIQGGDSVKISHNIMSGPGNNDFGNVAGAVGFILEHNNITMGEGTHFGNTISGSSSFTPVIRDNEFEAPAGFTGSNGAMLDLDQNVVNAKVVGNSFALIHGSSPTSIRLNGSVSANIDDNFFTCASGLGTTTGVLANTNAAHNAMRTGNYFYPSDPCTANVTATNVEVQNLQSDFASGQYLPNAEYWGNVDTNGSFVNEFGLDASNNTRIDADGAIIAQSHFNDSPHFRTDFYDASPSNNLGLEISDVVGAGPSTATFVGVNGLVVNPGGGIYDTSGNLLVRGNAGGNTGSGLTVGQTSPNLITPTIGGGAAISSSNNIPQFCGVSTFATSTTGTSVTCIGILTTSHCTVSWFGTVPVTAVNLGFTIPTNTTVEATASTAVSGTAALYCSVN